jgi:hypothetical protein
MVIKDNLDKSVSDLVIDSRPLSEIPGWKEDMRKLALCKEKGHISGNPDYIFNNSRASYTCERCGMSYDLPLTTEQRTAQDKFMRESYNI